MDLLLRGGGAVEGESGRFVIDCVGAGGGDVKEIVLELVGEAEV